LQASDQEHYVPIVQRAAFLPIGEVRRPNRNNMAHSVSPRKGKPHSSRRTSAEHGDEGKQPASKHVNIERIESMQQMHE